MADHVCWWHTTSMQPQGIPQSLEGLAPSFTFLSAANLQTVLAIIITLVFIWWAIFTIVAIYHWVRYGRDTAVAVPAIVLHLFVSGWIFVFATGGLH